MSNIVIAILLSILLTGIIFAITEGLLRLLNIKHPKNVFWLYFVILITAFSVIPFSLMASSSSTESVFESNNLTDISEHLSSTQAQSLNQNKSVQSKLFPIKTPAFLNNTPTALRYVFEVSWYDYYSLDEIDPSNPIIQENTFKEIPLTQTDANQNPSFNNSNIYLSSSFLLIIGALLSIILCYILFSFYFLKKRFLQKINATPCTNTEILHLVKKISHTLRIVPPKVYTYIGAPNAFVMGQPSILVFSQSLQTCLTKEEFKTALQHELTHIKHHDIIIKTFLQSLRIFFFFNPFVHILINKMIKKRELLADATYLTSKKEKIAFMEALVKITEYSRTQYHISSRVTPIQSLALVSIKSTHPSLSERFLYLFNTSGKKTILSICLSIVILLANAPILSFSQGFFMSTPESNDSIPADITFENAYYSEKIAYTTYDHDSQACTGIVVHKTLYNIVSIESLTNVSSLKQALSQYLFRHLQDSIETVPF